MDATAALELATVDLSSVSMWLKNHLRCQKNLHNIYLNSALDFSLYACREGGDTGLFITL